MGNVSLVLCGMLRPERLATRAVSITLLESRDYSQRRRFERDESSLYISELGGRVGENEQKDSELHLEDLCYVKTHVSIHCELARITFL